MDKDVVKNSSLPIDPPNRAATLHRFLSAHPKEAGVKIEGAYTAPVLKVRTHGPRKLNESSRKAWSFYLLDMQQRLVGAKHADAAKSKIESLLKTEPLELSVGMLLDPLERLMKAEQARLAGANSYVKRWLANEKAVLQIAVPQEAGKKSEVNENHGKAALETACTVLSRFPDCENGEINSSRICDGAYQIGHGLTREADEIEKDEARSTPPAHSPPVTPRRGASEVGSGTQFDALTASTSSTPGSASYRPVGRPGINMGASIDELKSRQMMSSNTAMAGQASEYASTSAPVTPRRRPFTPDPEAGTINASANSATSTRTPDTRAARSSLDKTDKSVTISFRQNSDESQTPSHRTRKPGPSRRAKSMVYAQTGTSDHLDSADQNALSAAGDAARALKANALGPRTDSAIYKKWEAEEKRWESVLTLQTGAAIRRLISYCHQVNLEQGKERASLDRVVHNLRPQIEERDAYIAVRDILLAESRGDAGSRATTAFPELLPLLIFAIDAQAAWRQESKSKSST